MLGYLAGHLFYYQVGKCKTNNDNCYLKEIQNACWKVTEREKNSCSLERGDLASHHILSLEKCVFFLPVSQRLRKPASVMTTCNYSSRCSIVCNVLLLFPCFLCTLKRQQRIFHANDPLSTQVHLGYIHTQPGPPINSINSSED